MWKDFLWKTALEKLLQHCLWKTGKLSTLACGEILLAALSKIPLFHINIH